MHRTTTSHFERFLKETKYGIFAIGLASLLTLCSNNYTTHKTEQHIMQQNNTINQYVKQQEVKDTYKLL